MSLPYNQKHKQLIGQRRRCAVVCGQCDPDLTLLRSMPSRSCPQKMTFAEWPHTSESILKPGRRKPHETCE